MMQVFGKESALVLMESALPQEGNSYELVHTSFESEFASSTFFTISLDQLSNFEMCRLCLFQTTMCHWQKLSFQQQS